MPPWNSKIVPIRFLGPSGYTSDAIQSIDYATGVNLDLTNNSWGGGSSSSLLRAAINRSGLTGALFGLDQIVTYTTMYSRLPSRL